MSNQDGYEQYRHMFYLINSVLPVIFIIHINIQLMEMQCLFKYWCTHILITQWHP